MVERVAIVTGDASGIGKAVVEASAGNDYQVVSIDLIEGDHDQSLSSRIDHLQADLLQSSACSQVVRKTLERYGRADILMNKAGFQHVAPISDFLLATWNRMISQMLTVPFLLTRNVWPTMQARAWVRIINMASIHGVVASPCRRAYISAKHGLNGLTKCCALEDGDNGIMPSSI